MLSTLVRSILGDAIMTPELVEKLDAISLEELLQKNVGVIGTLKKDTQSHTALAKPKRPTSAYHFWLKANRAYITKTVDVELEQSGTIVTGSVRNTIILQSAARLWKTTSDDIKSTYIAMFLKDQERYQTEMAAFRGPVDVVKRPRGRPKGSKNKLKTVSLPKTGDDSIAEVAVPIKRGRGRPKGSKNKPKVTEAGDEVESEVMSPKPAVEAPAPPKRGRGRPPGSKNKPKPLVATN